MAFIVLDFSMANSAVIPLNKIPKGIIYSLSSSPVGF